MADDYPAQSEVMADDLGMAALNPELAIRAEFNVTAQDPDRWLEATSLRPKKNQLTIAVTTKRPPPHSRWRFFLFWCLMKLAAKVWPFNFELYREPEVWEKGDR